MGANALFDLAAKKLLDAAIEEFDCPLNLCAFR